MNVVDDLWMPDVVNLVYCDSCLVLSEGIPVAIVIVSSIFMIELGRLSAFIRRAEGFVVPVLNNVNAIRIQ